MVLEIAARATWLSSFFVTFADLSVFCAVLVIVPFYGPADFMSQMQRAKKHVVFAMLCCMRCMKHECVVLSSAVG